MSSVKSVREFRKIVKLSEHHSLTISGSHKETRGNTVYETQWLDEKNAEEVVVARFRQWTNQSTKPPYRKQIGWERFSAKGALLDREIRYSKRDTNEWLH